MTVRGPIDARDMGLTLAHEHAVADTRPIAEQMRNPIAPDPAEVVDVVLPYLTRIRELGCRTFIDATGVGIGRHAALILRLSELSGLHMLCTTGAYAAADYQFLPPYVRTDSVEALAQRWIDEWRHGIEGTGIRPGFVKLSVNGAPLSEIEQKLLRASAITHRATGLTIGVHTGPAAAAWPQFAELEAEGIAPSAWVWIHAHNEPDLTQQVRAAQRGAWISFDGLNPERVQGFVAMVSLMRAEGLLHRLLVSQDAGWYSVGRPRGGELRPYDVVFTAFIPALRNAGFSQAEIDTIFIDNPANAFSVAVRARA
jgi:predicted metal-dependent phosphotriesterase family hydrolase